MKSSLFGVTIEGLTQKKRVDLACEFGFDAVEPFSSAELALPDLEEAARLRDYAQGKGKPISCFSAVACLVGSKAKDEVERLKKYADVCQVLGSPFLHHTLIPGLTSAGMAFSLPEIRREAARNAREVFDYAEQKGVACVYEDQGYSINGIESFSAYLDELDRPAGIVADLGNILFVDERPERFVGRFANRIVHVHVKDYLHKSVLGENPGAGWYHTRGGDYLRGTIIGHGVVGFEDVFRQLIAAGYKGYFSLEMDGLEEGYRATRLSLDNMNYYYDNALRDCRRFAAVDL